MSENTKHSISILCAAIIQIMTIAYQHVRHCDYTFLKKPRDPRIEKSIFSLKVSNSVGMLRGILNVKEHVETVGKTASSEKTIVGEASANPRGGRQSQPVRKTITSFRFGEH